MKVRDSLVYEVICSWEKVQTMLEELSARNDRSYLSDIGDDGMCITRTKTDATWFNALELGKARILRYHLGLDYQKDEVDSFQKLCMLIQSGQ